MLSKATQDQQNNIELMYGGLHWPDLDEDLSIDGMLAGRSIEDRDWLVSQVADWAKVSESTVRAAIRRGRLHAHKVGGIVMVKRSDARLWRANTRLGRPPANSDAKE